MSLKLHCDICDKSCDTAIFGDKPVLPSDWTRVTITHQFPPNPTRYMSTSEHILCPDCDTIVLCTKQIEHPQQEQPF